MPEIKLFDIVYLKEEIQNPPLMKGITGTVIYIYKPNKLFEVEFIAKSGETIASIVLEHNQINKLKESELTLIEELNLFRVRG